MWSINTATIVLFLCSTGTTLTSGYLWTTLVVNHNEDLSFYSPPLRLHSHGRITLSRRLHLRWCRWSLRRRLWEKSPFSIALGQVKELPIQPQARVSSLPFSFARSRWDEISCIVAVTPWWPQEANGFDPSGNTNHTLEFMYRFEALGNLNCSIVFCCCVDYISLAWDKN